MGWMLALILYVLGVFMAISNHTFIKTVRGVRDFDWLDWAQVLCWPLITVGAIFFASRLPPDEPS